MGTAVADRPRQGSPCVRAPDLADVEQEVVRGIQRGLARFDPARSADPSNALRSWIFAICRRQAANHRRASVKRNERICGTDELDLEPVDEANSEERLLAEERKRLLHRVLEELDPDQRAVKTPSATRRRCAHLGGARRRRSRRAAPAQGEDPPPAAA